MSEIIELSQDEKSVLEMSVNDINFINNKLLNSALTKLIQTGDKKAIADCGYRLALSYDRGRIVPHYERGQAWLIAATTAQQAGLPCALLFDLTAEVLSKDSQHNTAAKYFEIASNEGEKEGIQDEKIQYFLKEARRLFQLSGNSEKAGEVFIRENDFKLKNRGIFNKLFLLVFKYISQYGESPSRVALVALSIILICTAIYTISGIYSSSANQIVYSFSTSIYFSIVTFTTLGYGDYSPANVITRGVAATEAVCGLLLTSLYLVTLVRKYSR